MDPLTNKNRDILGKYIEEREELSYNYRLLEPFFGRVASPRDIASHLDQLLFILSWYQEREGVQCHWHVYQNIYMFKRILQDMYETGPKDERQAEYYR